ncbi:hypothetical protein HPB50_011399 [Hyalomma asiaticum]|uniref:Uncharacterized protein n=1 Tax=Hyalomma asiaticum TaxID=266040 RepID=A0ACB7SBQ8_HYAAI|nr:hypothetical protein HPB50_011399 [Hyalomma asiaticum]
MFNLTYILHAHFTMKLLVKQSKPQYCALGITYQAPRADPFQCSWSCPKTMAGEPMPNPCPSSWEAALRAICSDDQLWLVHRACVDMSARGFPDV